MISCDCFCSRHIESMRLGQLQLVNSGVILRPPAWCETHQIKGSANNRLHLCL